MGRVTRPHDTNHYTGWHNGIAPVPNPGRAFSFAATVAYLDSGFRRNDENKNRNDESESRNDENKNRNDTSENRNDESKCP